MKVGLPAKLVLAFGAMTACFSAGDDDSNGGQPYGTGFCEAMTSKVMECGVASSDGSVGCGATGLSLCDVKCLADSSCQELTALSCLGTPTQDLIDCLAGCSALELSCDDGSTAYAEGDRCDGQAVCDDSADEAGCARFTCDDGEPIALGLVCDGTPDCADESDEVGCQPLTSTCPGGGEGGAGGAGTAGTAGSAGDAGSGGESGDASGGEGGSADAPNLVASPTESCDRISQRLAACDPSDDFYLHCYGDTVTYDKCLADCMEAASCDDILASACDLPTDNAVYDCLTACEPASFECGDGSLVREQWLCDSTFDCADGSDEDACPITPVYECPNDADTTYVALDRCDQFVSCVTDAADELGCACLPAP